MSLAKSRKGDVPITMLVIGVFAVCSLALLTFFINDFQISNSFAGVETMNKMNTLSEEYVFYSARLDEEEFLSLKRYFNWTQEGEKRYFEYSRSYDKSNWFQDGEEITLFYVKYPVPVK